MKITPILFVEAIEPALPFWTERAGFAKTVEVPDGGRLGLASRRRAGTWWCSRRGSGEGELRPDSS